MLFIFITISITLLKYYFSPSFLHICQSLPIHAGLELLRTTGSRTNLCNTDHSQGTATMSSSKSDIHYMKTGFIFFQWDNKMMNIIFSVNFLELTNDTSTQHLNKTAFSYRHSFSLTFAPSSSLFPNPKNKSQE